MPNASNDDNDLRGARRERDMILAPNEYTYISDETKGEVCVFVGPNKQSLAGTDRCVTFDLKSKRFKTTTLEAGTQTFQTAPEGWYIVLKNPASNDKHPTGSGKLTTPDLNVGKKVNISGPASFPLWPGQMAKVVQGHSLRSNEYLMVRVYDEEAAKANLAKAVIKTQVSDSGTQPQETEAAGKNSKKEVQASKQQPTHNIISIDDLTMGKLYVIRGTEVSFYIPPTGIEVVPEKVNGEERYVREAVSLERLEYCLLLDQNGNKRYVIGPDVVFPKPTEKFVEAPIKSNPEKAKAKKFRAQELTPTSGIHIRVITDYTEADGTVRKPGDELFITGATNPVYFPREEHAIIKYGEQDVHFGIAIPAGEARYVLNRLTGVASLVEGPQIFLPDPRTQVILQRALPLKVVSLLYPGNQEALEINAARAGSDDQDVHGAAGANAAFLNSNYARSETENEAYGAVAAVATPEAGRRYMIRGSSKSLPGDSFDRKAKFTAPRSVILNTKYDGAVCVRPWTGFAMLLVRGNARRVIQGPGAYMLEYDEIPQVMTLSTGKPKTTDNMTETVYLQTTANKVSDIVDVETKDFCQVSIKLSYRVNFEGSDPMKWFAVDNYVKFLCDHMRSKLRAAVQKLGIEHFYSNQTEIVRDVILGKSTEGGKRTGTAFEENGMRIYDVEVLKVEMKNQDIEKMLVNGQRNSIANSLNLAEAGRKFSYDQEMEKLKRETAAAQAETQEILAKLSQAEADRKLALSLQTLANDAKLQAERETNNRKATEARIELEELQLESRIEARKADLELDALAQQQKLAELSSQVQAVVEKSKAITPDLIAALQAFGDKALVEKVAESMAPMALLTGGKKSVAEVLQELLRGTDLAKTLVAVTEKVNGKSSAKNGTASA